MGLHAGELVVAGPREEDIVMPDHAEERRPPHPTLASAEEIPAAATPQGLCPVALGGGGKEDYYDVSLVDGYNVAIDMRPYDGSGANCLPAGCVSDLNSVCPAGLAVRDVQKVLQRRHEDKSYPIPDLGMMIKNLEDIVHLQLEQSSMLVPDYELDHGEILCKCIHPILV